MKVHEIIASLQNYDKDAEFEILVESKEDSFDTTEFVMEGIKFSFGKYVILKIKPDSHVVVDEASYEDLKQDKLESEELAERMSSFVEELEQKVNEMEQN